MIDIFYKIHKTTGGEVLAACDKELLGKTLRDGSTEFFVSEKFYKEKETSEKELREKLKSFDNINLIGNKVVRIAIQEKLVEEKSVLYIKGIAHAQIFRV